MSTDQSHVQFVVKWKKVECDQSFLTTNYPDLLIRKTIINSVLDRELITRLLPKDELKLSTFITNRDDYIYHEISRNLRREFFSVLRDECKENFAKQGPNISWNDNFRVFIPTDLVGPIILLLLEK